MSGWHALSGDHDVIDVGAPPAHLTGGATCGSAKSTNAAKTSRAGVRGSQVIFEVNLALQMNQGQALDVRIGLNGESQLFGTRSTDGSDDDIVVAAHIVPRDEFSLNVTKPDRYNGPDPTGRADFRTGNVRIAIPTKLLVDHAGYEWGVDLTSNAADQACSQTRHLLTAPR